jgi:hypothetical protein
MRTLRSTRAGGSRTAIDIAHPTLDAGAQFDLRGFKRFFETRNDRLFTVPDGHATNLDTFVEVHRQSVRLTMPIEDLVFIEA